MTARVADGARRRLGLGLLAGALLPGVATRAAAMPGPDVRPDHASPGPRRWRAPLMGTVVTVLVDHPDVARREAALQALVDEQHHQLMAAQARLDAVTGKAASTMIVKRYLLSARGAGAELARRHAHPAPEGAAEIRRVLVADAYRHRLHRQRRLQ